MLLYALSLLSRRFGDLYKSVGDSFCIWGMSRYLKSISIQRMGIHCSIHNENSENGYHCNMAIVTELLVGPGPCGSSGRYSQLPAIVQTWWYTGSCYLMCLSNLLPNEYYTVSSVIDQLAGSDGVSPACLELKSFYGGRINQL